ncbi:FHA domain-containing protein [Kineosporia rhizophila]|uniref:FtsK/SpoIIIE domain-containing protein n=1 Tax=Kineosporia rhizophila TaxID=84633 RepID=UPI001E4CC9D2|nr:FtsK/SpoIIIE domain-containing protein [Kineosporia rhizophila]MCE0535206.1 FHA domain-containing protein [Kineosporia rhizophila]
MIIRLTVLDPQLDPQGGAEHDVEISASGESTVRSLLAALPFRVGDRPCYVGHEWLDPDEVIENSPLTVGSYLTIGQPGPLTRPVAPNLVARLLVLSGPDAGRSLFLPEGTSTLGRSAGADVKLRDPKISREHAHISAAREGITIQVTEAADQANGITVEGERIGAPRFLAPGQRFQVGDDVLQVIASPGPPVQLSRTTDAHLEFDRAYAPTPRVSPLDLSFPSAPAEGSSKGAMVVAMFVPMLLGVAMALIMKQPAMLLFAAFTPITMGATAFFERRARRERMEKFENSRSRVAGQIDQATVTEIQVRHAQAPDPESIALIASGSVRGLWPRDGQSDEALLLRVGRYDRPASITLRGEPWVGFEDPWLRGVPWTVDLRATGVLGLVGPPERTTQVANWLLTQLATLRSPADLRIVVLTPDGDPDLAWTRWLPHVVAGDGGETPCAIGVTPATRGARLDELKQLIAIRQDALREVHNARIDQHVVVVLQGALSMRKVPGIREVLHDGPEVGVYSICIDTRDMIDCRGLVRLDGDTVTAWGDRSGTADAIVPERFSSRQAEVLARALAPMRDRLSARDDPGALPYPQRFLDLVGLARPTPEDVLKLWDEHPGPQLEVPLGADAQGPVTVDLAGQGPHTMLAGATGAGKSILLQTLVTSLLLANRPDELNLVLVDFKGGSAFLPFEHCPHVVALIRNTEDDPAQKFDEAAAQRVLASVRAEVRRRESMLGRHGGEIDNYWKARRSDPRMPALPRLVMVFDEYARAMDTSPDFPKELMAVAGKGRSLGMHLVFATQSLQGKLSPEMKNNISLRITLRQNEKSDSVEVLGTPDAVGIPGRFKGRGLILCTLDESRQPRPFQSGYLGDPPPDGTARPASVRHVDWSQLGLPRPSAGGGPVRGETDQTLSIAAVEAASRAANLPPMKRPLLPPLPALLRTGNLRMAPPGSLAFAVADDPENQEQPVLALDLAGTDRWMIAGGPQSGRTNALRALINGVSIHRSDQVHLYVVANREGELNACAALPHTGAVMHIGEPDRIRRLVTWLAEEVQKRTRERFASGAPRPALVVLVDGWEGLENRNQGLFDETSVLTMLYEVIQGGPPVGVHVVVTGGQVMINGRLPDLFNRRVLLAFPNESARRAAIGGQFSPPPRLPGRGIETATGCHVQIFQVDEADFTARTREAHSLTSAPRALAALPVHVPLGERILWQNVPSPTWIPLGRGGPHIEPLGVDLFGDDPHLLLISGPEGSGRSTSANAIVQSLLHVGIPVLAIAPPRSPLQTLAGLSPQLTVLSGTTWNDEKLRTAVAPFEGGRHAVVVDDFDQMKIEARIENFAPAPTLLEDLADPASAGTRALVLCGDAGPVLEGSVRSLARVVETSIQNGTRLVLAPTGVFAARQLGFTLERDQILPVPPGRGYLAVRRSVQPIQAAGVA